MDGITTYLLTQGVLGIVALVEGAVIVKLYNKIDRLEKDKLDMAELRRLDQKEVTEKVLPIMSSFSQTVNLIETKLLVSKQQEK